MPAHIYLGLTINPRNITTFYLDKRKNPIIRVKNRPDGPIQPPVPVAVNILEQIKAISSRGK